MNQSTVITCSASDPDGDPLTYTWSKTGGTITGTSSAITWTAPATAGTYTITCTISDGELTDEQSISIDVEQELSPGITEPELIEIASGEIDLNEGGVVEVTDPNSELYGLKLTIEPQKNIRENKGTPIINIAIYCALLDICKLPDFQGFLITPFIIKSDFTDALFGKLEIPYYMEQLINSGVAINAPVKVCRVPSSPLPWEELSSGKYTVSNNIVNIPIGLGDFMYYYTLTVNNAAHPNSSGFKNPQPGDLLYKFSKLPPANINEGWCSGHVGIYVGEKYDEEEEKPYNVIEALLGGVTRSYHSPINEFGGDSTYLGAREPEGGLSHQQRNKIIEFVEAAATAHIPYAWFETFTSVIYSGLGYGNAVKGPDKFNCVGLTEAAYEYAGVDLVSNYDEGNVIYGPYHILTPAEQWYKTVPASGVLVQNNPPNITSTPVTSATKGQPYSYDVNATDFDGDTLVYLVTTKPTGMTINSTTGLINWTPTAIGSFGVTVKVYDGELFASQSFTITVQSEVVGGIVTGVSAMAWARGLPLGGVLYERYIQLQWDSYPGAIGYNVYRSVNQEEYSIVSYEDTTDSFNHFIDIDVSTGNNYAYYITACGSDWETAPSEILNRNTWLPCPSIISPEDGATITNPNPTFTWTPVGITSFPYGNIYSASSVFLVHKFISEDEGTETVCRIDFPDLTTSTTTYDQDEDALSLVAGNYYDFNTLAWGFDESGTVIALSCSAIRRFYYTGE